MKIAESMKDTTQDIMASYNQRIKAVGAIVDDTRSTLNRFRRDHAAMGKEQKAELAKGETERLKTFKGMMSDIQKGIKDIETHVASQLKEFTDAHADMSAEQKAELAKGETERLKTFKGMMSDIQKGIKDMAAEVASLIGGYRADMNHTHAAWSSMAKTMAKARNKGILPTIETGGDVSSVEEAVEKKRKKKEKEEKVEEGGEG